MPTSCWPSGTRASGARWTRLKDKEVLEDMVEQGSMPWRLGSRLQRSAAGVGRKVG